MGSIRNASYAPPEKEKRMLFGIIADEETTTGFLLAGIGESFGVFRSRSYFMAKGYKNWETDLSQLFCSNSNPSTNKLPVHLSLGTNDDNCTFDTLEEISATTSSETKRTATPVAKHQRKCRCTDNNDQPVNKKLKAVLSRYETDETRDLNFQSLQRLVVLKQNKVKCKFCKKNLWKETCNYMNLDFY